MRSCEQRVGGVAEGRRGGHGPAEEGVENPFHYFSTEGSHCIFSNLSLSKRRRGPATKTCDDTQRALHSAVIQES